MPIINGQKMACAPCIRGHRSTKCNHFNDRVMCPVRKPGRPLSTCPCAPGKPCACGGVKVAIPRKQQCGCPSESEQDSNGIEQDHSPTESQTSPTRPSFRVQKSNSNSRSRKQSFDPVNLGRIDPMSINLVRQQNSSLDANATAMIGNGTGASNGIATQVALSSPPGYNVGIGYGHAGAGSVFTHPRSLSYGPPITYGMDTRYAQPQHQIPLQVVKTEEESFSSSQLGGLSMPLPPTSLPSATRSCCSPPLAPPPPPAELRVSLMPKPNGTANGIAPRASCCGGGKEDVAPKLDSDTSPVSPSDFDKLLMSQFQSPLDMKHQAFSPAFETPVFTYPANLGSWQQPVNQEMWQQIASQPTLSLNTSLPTPTNGHTGDLVGTSHQCSCGPGCQCIGCLAHPFNEQMYRYVNNAYTNHATTTSTTNGHMDLAAGVSAGATAGGPGQSTAYNGGAGYESPPEAQTPSDTSALSDEQNLSTLDYFFVNLPIQHDGTCGGFIGNCPCGDDCMCPGCLVHHTAVSPN
ncbi:hypothetical protein B0T22DRAFT_285767 [Podospora appendiculata]|uniref:Copper-fist domain-containing protein n=1 Tax=Podospora appendiculata TaxID=314037 RepID=A0AAE0X150_9PEZI|nr:hypothetical protein B0T22DRAFT_285767 [Podospora appendiculata]